MKSCTTCKFERPLMYCLQGHVRKIKYSMEDKLKVLDHEPIENCHGWEEKIVGECSLCSGRYQKPNGITIRYGSPLTDRNIHYEHVSFCPECGRKLI